MGFRDRFTTPRTARAILSWRILLGAGVGVAAGFAGLPIAVAIAVGVAIYAASVGAAMPREPERPAIDPFTLGEPWRHLVLRAQTSERELRATVDRIEDGPLRRTLLEIADQLGRGVDEAWEIARRGNEIDDAVRRLDPTGLRSRLASAEQRHADTPTDDAEVTIASLQRQLESAERLRGLSDDTAAALRRSQTQLDELVARASEVQIGPVDTDSFRRDVDDLVIRLEALNLAIEETRHA